MIAGRNATAFFHPVHTPAKRVKKPFNNSTDYHRDKSKYSQRVEPYVWIHDQ